MPHQSTDFSKANVSAHLDCPHYVGLRAKFSKVDTRPAVAAGGIAVAPGSSGKAGELSLSQWRKTTIRTRTTTKGRINHRPGDP
jgi:hypothetical protein